MQYGYIRVSTEDQALGIEAQRQAIKNALPGPSPIKFHIDEISGTAPIQKRQGLMNLIGALRKGDTVWVLRRDRIARDAVIAGMIVRLVQKRGARMMSVDGIGNGDGPEASLIATVVDAVAQYERAMISIRTAAALNVKRLRGEKLGGTTPYGYVVVERDGTKVLEPEPEQQERIADMVEMRDAGMAYDQIAEFMNSRKFPPPNGLRWYGRTVNRILGRAAGHESE
jgi:DNA invertase Pin-like site-specific DNA recombinase